MAILACNKDIISDGSFTGKMPALSKAEWRFAGDSAAVCFAGKSAHHIW